MDVITEERSEGHLQNGVHRFKVRSELRVLPRCARTKNGMGPYQGQVLIRKGFPLLFAEEPGQETELFLPRLVFGIHSSSSATAADTNAPHFPSASRFSL